MICHDFPSTLAFITLLLALAVSGAGAAPGDWPVPRQNRRLTTFQPLPGRMRAAPEVIARHTLGRGQGALTVIPAKPGEERVIAIADGRLACYRLDGTRLWEIHPPGLNFETLVAAEDLDGDGKIELALTAGRTQNPMGAAVVVAADTGEVRFRYDVEPMSYSWFLKVDRYLPGVNGKQLVVCMQGYPPDKEFGYIALFDFPKPGAPPTQRWRYNFSDYTAYPSLLTSDVDGDGVAELCVVTHSRMWVLDARTGAMEQFLKWDVAPGNVRSYGLVQFQDLNGDGREDFFCIATFAMHHEVLLNQGGKLVPAWAHGWDNSVSTSKMATVWAEPPIADVDGDGRLEMVLSMFNAETEPRWMVRIYDVVTGELKAKVMDRIAAEVADLDGDGVAEILADISKDPTRAVIDGAVLLKHAKAPASPAFTEEWRADGWHAAHLVPQPWERTVERTGPAAHRGLKVVDKAGTTQEVQWQAGRGATTVKYQAPPPPPRTDLAKIPAAAGVAVNAPLVADVDGDGRNEIVHYHDGKASVFRYEAGRGLVAIGSYPSSGAPILADLDGDGAAELVVGSASATADPVIRALRPGKGRAPLWEVTLPRPERPGLPFGRALYFQAGRFTGEAHDDLYVLIGTPLVRSLVLAGRTGKLLWEKGEAPVPERYYGPTSNQGAVWDANGDGKEDLVFTIPDYYVVVSGADGSALIGPDWPPKIFSQPSLGLYTLPAVLESGKGEPTVCLVNGHYFQAAMTLRAQPKWYRLPETGVAPAGAEGFLRLADGSWLMGFGRQDGRFVCVEVETGKTRWELPLEASASAVASADIDGDGRPEFVFGTSHGDLYAVGDGGDKPRLVWKAHFPVSVGAPVIADVDGDGVCEILVGMGDGDLCVLQAPRANEKR